MLIKQYLKQRVNSKGRVAISKAEAKILRLKLPVNTESIGQAGDKPLTSRMVQALTQAILGDEWKYRSIA